MIYNIICLLFISILHSGRAQDDVFRIKEGERLMVTCSFENQRGCAWSNQQGSIFNDDNYKASMENGECKLTIMKVSFETDNGRIVCAESNELKKTKKIIVLVPPMSEYLELTDGSRLNNQHLVIVDDYSPGAQTAALELNCVVEGGSPNATIQWQLFGEDVLPISVRATEIPNHKGFFKIISTYEVTFDDSHLHYSIHRLNENYEKNLTCKIFCEAYVGREKNLDIIVVKKYKTEKVDLELEQDRIDGKQKLICEADGYPTPDITFENVDKAWSQSTGKSNTMYVNEGGKYVCLAGNELNTEKVKSNEVQVHHIGEKIGKSELAVELGKVYLKCQQNSNFPVVESLFLKKAGDKWDHYGRIFGDKIEVKESGTYRCYMLSLYNETAISDPVTINV